MEMFRVAKPSLEHRRFLTTAALLLALIVSHAPPTTGRKVPPTYTTFVKKSCSNTTHPSLCVKTLSPYATAVKTNSLKLCSAALTVSVQSTRNCSAAVSKLAGLREVEARAARDCIGELKDAVYELKRTAGAMAHLRDGGDREFQWASAKTYASAAITDAETCLDGFLDRKVSPVVRKKIRSCVSGVEKHISNALSLINHLF